MVEEALAAAARGEGKRGKGGAARGGEKKEGGQGFRAQLISAERRGEV